MQPYRVSLSFLGHGWTGVKLEVAHDEIGGISYTDHDSEPAEQLTAIAAVLGLGELKPVPLISLELQIAQKIHAVTEPGSDRAHDLVDLQLLWHAGTSSGTAAGESLDLPLLTTLCERTFAFRQRHPWPPVDFTMPDLLEEAYRKALEEARTTPDTGDHEPDNGEPNDDEPQTHKATADLADTMADATAWLNDRLAELTAESAAEITAESSH